MRKEGERNANVGGNVQFAAQVEILEVNGHEFSVGHANDAIEHQIGCSNVCRFGGGVAVVNNAVATGCPTDSSGLRFLGAVSTDNTDIGRFTVFWELSRADEVQGIGASRHVGVGSESLKHSADLFGVGFVPKGAIAASAELVVAGDGVSIGINSGTMHCPVLLILVNSMG